MGLKFLVHRKWAIYSHFSAYVYGVRRRHCQRLGDVTIHTYTHYNFLLKIMNKTSQARKGGGVPGTDDHKPPPPNEIIFDSVSLFLKKKTFYKLILSNRKIFLASRHFQDFSLFAPFSIRKCDVFKEERGQKQIFVRGPTVEREYFRI